MKTTLLVDCNNFYVSCERVFNPALEKRPVVILSNNDGCVISRSQEAKKMGIQMGEPFFKIKAFCRAHEVLVFSSNYALYGNLSERIMNILINEAPEVDVYSIDEAFLRYSFDVPSHDLVKMGKRIRDKILKWTGIPTSIGIGPNKTLAKIAGEFAKKAPEGVFDLSSLDKQELILKNFPVEEIWGIGRNLKVRLNALGIHTALELKTAEPTVIRHRLGVVGERILRELQGFECLPLSQIPKKKSITHSRSFGNVVSDFDSLYQALSTYINMACIKLRRQKLCTQACVIFIESLVNAQNGARSTQSAVLHLPELTNDAAFIIKMSKKPLERLFHADAKYKKCGVILLDLKGEQELFENLFINPQEVHLQQSLLKTFDEINDRFGKNSLFYGAMGIKRPWTSQSNIKSPCYTSWEELPVVKA